MTKCGNILRFFVLSLLLCGVIAKLLAADSPRTAVKLEVVSVRKLPEGECRRRTPHVIGGLEGCFSVRLRLSAPKSTGVFFYSFANSVDVIGYTVRLTGRKITWFWGDVGTRENDSSPGLQGFSPAETQWLLLPPGTSIEWEEFNYSKVGDQNFGGQTHAFTCFIKSSEDGRPTEIVSGSFVVPQKD